MRGSGLVAFCLHSLSLSSSRMMSLNTPVCGASAPSFSWGRRRVPLLLRLLECPKEIGKGAGLRERGPPSPSAPRCSSCPRGRRRQSSSCPGGSSQNISSRKRSLGSHGGGLSPSSGNSRRGYEILHSRLLSSNAVSRGKNDGGCPLKGGVLLRSSSRLPRPLASSSSSSSSSSRHAPSASSSSSASASPPERLYFSPAATGSSPGSCPFLRCPASFCVFRKWIGCHPRRRGLSSLLQANKVSRRPRVDVEEAGVQATSSSILPPLDSSSYTDISASSSSFVNPSFQACASPALSPSFLSTPSSPGQSGASGFAEEESSGGFSIQTPEEPTASARLVGPGASCVPEGDLLSPSSTPGDGAEGAGCSAFPSQSAQSLCGHSLGATFLRSSEPAADVPTSLSPLGRSSSTVSSSSSLAAPFFTCESRSSPEQVLPCSVASTCSSASHAPLHLSTGPTRSLPNAGSGDAPASLSRTLSVTSSTPLGGSGPDQMPARSAHRTPASSPPDMPVSSTASSVSPSPPSCPLLSSTAPHSSSGPSSPPLADSASLLSFPSPSFCRDSPSPVCSFSAWPFQKELLALEGRGLHAPDDQARALGFASAPHLGLETLRRLDSDQEKLVFHWLLAGGSPSDVSQPEGHHMVRSEFSSVPGTQTTDIRDCSGPESARHASIHEATPTDRQAHPGPADAADEGESCGSSTGVVSSGSPVVSMPFSAGDIPVLPPSVLSCLHVLEEELLLNGLVISDLSPDVFFRHLREARLPQELEEERRREEEKALQTKRRRGRGIVEQEEEQEEGIREHVGQKPNEQRTLGAKDGGAERRAEPAAVKREILLNKAWITTRKQEIYGDNPYPFPLRWGEPEKNQQEANVSQEHAGQAASSTACSLLLPRPTAFDSAGSLSLSPPNALSSLSPQLASVSDSTGQSSPTVPASRPTCAPTPASHSLPAFEALAPPSVPLPPLQWQPSRCSSQEAAWILEKRQIIVERCVWQRMLEEAEQHLQDANRGTSVLVEGASAKRVWCFWVQEMRVKIALLQEEQRRRLQKVVSRKATLVGKKTARKKKQRIGESLLRCHDDTEAEDSGDRGGQPVAEAVAGIEAQVGEEELQRELAEAECLLPLELDPTVLAVITAKTAVQLTLVPKACTSVLPGRKGRAGGAEGREASAELMAEHEDTRRLLARGQGGAEQPGVLARGAGSVRMRTKDDAQDGEERARAACSCQGGQKQHDHHAATATGRVTAQEEARHGTALQGSAAQKEHLKDARATPCGPAKEERRRREGAQEKSERSSEEDAEGQGCFLDAMAAALRHECAQRQVPVTQMALAIAEAVNLELNAVRLERQRLGEDTSLPFRPGATGPDAKHTESSSSSLLARSRLLKEHELLAKRAQGKLNGAERRQLHRLLLCGSRHETWDVRKKLKVGGVLLSVLLKHAFVEADYTVAKTELAEELKQLEHERQLLRRAAERKKKKVEEERICGARDEDLPPTCLERRIEETLCGGASTGHTGEKERTDRPGDLFPSRPLSSWSVPPGCPACDEGTVGPAESSTLRGEEGVAPSDPVERLPGLSSSSQAASERQERCGQVETNKGTGQKRRESARGRILYGEAWDAEAFAHLTVYRSRRCFTKVEVPAFHHRVIYNPRTQRSLGVVEMRRLCYSQLANCGGEERGALAPGNSKARGSIASLQQHNPQSPALVAPGTNRGGAGGDFRKLPAGRLFASSPAFWSFLKFLPMVYPPIPWTGFSEGGYLMLRNSFVRAVTYAESKGPSRRKSKEARDEDEDDVDEDVDAESDVEDGSTQSSGGKNGPKKKPKKSSKKVAKITFLGGAGRVKMARDFRVYDTSVPREILSALGAQPWRINKEVLAVMETAWQRGIRVGRMPPREGWCEAEQGFDDPSSLGSRHRSFDHSALFALAQRQLDGRGGASPTAAGSGSVQAKENSLSLNGLRGALDPARIRLQHLLQEEAKMRSERPSFLLKLRVAQCFQHVDTLYFPHNIDFRGRCYPVPPHLNHMGDDICRALLVFAQGRPLGPRGLFWLKVHLANLFGKNKLSFPEREAWIDERLPTLLEVAKDPLNPRNLELWGEEAEDPWQALGVLLELKHALASGDPATYTSRQPVHQDGSCNGLQHYAALGRDARGGEAVNLVPGERPQDVYSLVLEVVKTRVHADIDRKPSETEGRLAMLLKQLDLLQRKVVKQTVMTICYGVTALGARDQVTRQLQDLVGDKLPPETVKQLGSYLARTVLASIGEIFKSAMRLKQWLDRVSKLSNRVGLPVAWMLPIVNLAAEQPYRSTQALEVKTALQCHIIRVTNEDTPTSAAKQRLGFPPNFIHSLDATHMMLTARRCLLGKTFPSSIVSTPERDSDVSAPETPFAFSAVHDSYWTHAADVDRMRRALREEFVHLYSQPILEEFYECIRARFGRLAEELPPPPAKGNLDLRGVLRSEYFFH